jgi:hypothetical protein
VKSSPTVPLPRALRLAIGVVAVETAVVWMLIAVLSFAVSRDEGTGALRSLGYVGLYAVAFPYLMWGLLRRRKWARAPLIVLQLLLMAVGVVFAKALSLPLGALIVLAAAGCVIALVVPSTREVLT